jgi:hypothetical protein
LAQLASCPVSKVSALFSQALNLYPRRLGFQERSESYLEKMADSVSEALGLEQTESGPADLSPAAQGRAGSLIALAAAIVVAPMIFLGNVSGHDFSFHLASWFDAAGQWREGIAFPRWAEWANWGFGEPRFVFYPPASWALGAALSSLLPHRVAPGVYIWLVLAVGGWAMWRLAREFLPDSQAIATSIIFVLNPYQLVVVYYRSDFAELLAAALFPLLILGVLRVVRDASLGWSRDSWRNVPLLGLVFAAIWLSNAPAAVIATYCFVLVFVVGCIERRSLRPLLPGAAAMVLGFAMAAFYILPAAHEQRWVQIGDVLAGNLHLDQNFLYSKAIDPDFVLFNWKVSTVALGTMLFAGVAAVFSARRRQEYPLLFWTILSLAVASSFMMFPLSLWFWLHLPKLVYLQFPWRWLVPLGVPYAFFLVTAIGSARGRWVGYAALSLVIAATATAIIRDAWWDSQDVLLLETAIRTGHGYEGTDEYAPLGSDRYELPGAILEPDSPDIFEEEPPIPPGERLDALSQKIVPARGLRISISRATAEEKDMLVETAEPTTLAPRLLNYPAWNVELDGTRIEPGSQRKTARMLIPVPAGRHRVEVRFGRTSDRTTGAAISGLSAILWIGCVAFTRRRKHATAVR